MTDKYEEFALPLITMFRSATKAQVVENFHRDNEIPVPKDSDETKSTYLIKQLEVMKAAPADALFCDICYQQAPDDAVEDDEYTCSCTCAFGSYSKLEVARDILEEELEELQ